MAIRVLFHGRIIRHPGAEAFTNLAGMVQPGVDERKVAGGIAEADFGEPGAVHVFGNSEEARQIFGVSDAADLVRILFNPSNDSRIDGGAEVVYLYKVNRTTRAERWIVKNPKYSVGTTSTVQAISFSPVGSPTGAVRDDTTDPITPAYLDFTTPALDFPDDSFNNLILEVVSGPGKGQQRYIQTSVDQTGNTTRVNLRDDQDWDFIPTTASIVRIVVPMAKLIAREWGTRGNDNETEFGRQYQNQSYELQTKKAKRINVPKSPFGGLRDPIFHVKLDPTGGGPAAIWQNPANWAIPQAQVAGPLPVEGTTTASATPLNGLLLDAATNALVTNDQVDRWVIITGVDTNIAAQIPLLGRAFKILSNTTTDLTLARPGLGLPTGTNLTGLQWKVASLTDSWIEVDGQDGTARSFSVKYRDKTGGDITLKTVDLTVNKTLADLENELDGTMGIFSTIGNGVNPAYETKKFDFGVLSDHYGRDKRTVIPAGLTAGDTGGVCAISDNLPSTANSSTWFARLSPGLSVEEIVTVTTNTTATETLVFSATKNDHAANCVIEHVHGSQIIRGPGDISDLGYPVKNNLEKLLEFITNNVGEFTHERAVGPGSTDTLTTSAAWNSMIGSTQPEDDGDLFKVSYGGSAGTSILRKPSNTTAPGYPISWEHGMDTLLKQKNIRVEVLAASQDLPSFATDEILTLVSDFSEHLRECDDNKTERQGYMGLALPLEAGTYDNVTYSKGLLDVIREQNDARMSICGQQPRLIDSSGQSNLKDEWAMAALCAGTQIATDLGEPITLKYIRTSELVQRFGDWDPQDPLDMRKAIEGRLLYGEAYKNFWRVVRGFSTHVQTENLAQTDTNIWEIRNHLQRRYREKMEERFGGRGVGVARQGVRFSAPASVGSIREAMDTLLSEDRANGIIVDSLDDNDVWQNAWINLSVKILGDVATIILQVFPKTGLNFILIDFNFQLPKLSA